MSSSSRFLSAIVGILGRTLSASGGHGRQSRPHAAIRRDGEDTPRRSTPDTGRMPGSETIRIDPEGIRHVSVGYSPSQNGLPDSGEVIWTWVPFEENDGRGKDRPVLVIGRHEGDRVYAVRMTSRVHDRDRDFIPIGSGGWDRQGRDSWVDIEQLFSVHHAGMRREAAVLDAGRYGRVAQALLERYGWARVSRHRTSLSRG